jgi:hypothetical protein
MARISSLMICLSFQMLDEAVFQSSGPITKQAVMMRFSQIFLHLLAPLLLSPYIVEACLLPLLESLCKVSSVSGLSKNRTAGGKKHGLMLFLDVMWAFLEVSSLIICLFLVCSMMCSFSKII